MTIRYSLTLREYIRHSNLSLWHLFRIRPWFVSLAAAAYLFLLAPAAFDFYERHLAHLSTLPFTVGPSFISRVMPLIWIPAVIALAMVLSWQLQRKHLLEIDNETVAIHQGWHRLRLRWRVIDYVDQDGEYIYIGSKYVRARWPSYGVVLFATLPKRVFSSPNEAQAFLNKANDYWKAATGQPAEISNAWPPAPKSPESEFRPRETHPAASNSVLSATPPEIKSLAGGAGSDVM